MKYLDLTLPGSAPNLACDDALLDVCEATGERGVLRLYEPREVCVVVGYGNRRAAEVDLPACQEAGIPVLRRISGGGTVVLGPGCLAYALVLPVDAHPDLASVTGTNRHVMEALRATCEGLLGRAVHVRGHTDLTLGDRKFSGNAQRRRRSMVLFHGTLLCDFDLRLMERVLRTPTVQPEYRRGRRHADFVANAPLQPAAMKEALQRVWGAWEPWPHSLEAPLAQCMEQRYSRPDWHALR